MNLARSLIFLQIGSDVLHFDLTGTDADTRITSVWVKESDGEWRVKSIHFSPANYGGTHKTQSSDFDD